METRKGWGMVFMAIAFAVLAIYFYSTSIVNAGMGELFVAIKGAMIVLGTFFVQVAQIMAEPLYVGAIVGLLSASVLFINSFPDHDADKAKGRKTLVIMMGKTRASRFFVFFPLAVYCMIAVGILLNMTTIYSLICVAAIPLAVKAGISLRRNLGGDDTIIPAMSFAVKFSRLTGVLLALSFLLGF